MNLSRLMGERVLKVEDGVCPCVTANEAFADRDKRLVSFALTRVRLQCGRMSSHRMPGQQFPSSSRDMPPVVECYNSKIGTTPSLPSNFQFYLHPAWRTGRFQLFCYFPALP